MPMNRLLLLFVLVSQLMCGQVGIGTTAPNSKSILDIHGTDKGILIPRLTTAQMNAIASPPQSLMVFNVDVNLYYYYSTSSSSWMPVNVGSIKTITGNTYTLSEDDNGRILDFTSNSSIVLNVPGTLPVGFQVSITQAGTGQVEMVGTSGMVLNNRWGAKFTSGQWSKAGLEVRASSMAILSGDLK